MEMFKLIISYIYFAILCVEVLLLCGVVACKIIKRHHAKKQEASEVEVLNTELKLSHEAVDKEKAENMLISSIIPACMEVAEKSGIVGAELKKMLAMSQCMLMCSEKHIEWSKVADFVSKKIEELIDFSKAINHKGR